MNQPRILITGTTGYVGGRLRERLENVGYPLRCLIRSKNSIPLKYPASTQYIVGDALDKKSLIQALQGIDIAYYLIHSMGSGDDIEIDREIAVQFAEVAAASKVKKIIYLGGLGNNYEEGLSPHLKARHEVGHILRAHSSEVKVFEFRASIIIGSGSLSFEMIRGLVEKFPVLIAPKWMDTEAQPIGIDDLLIFLVGAIDCALDGNPLFEIGGKTRGSYKDLMNEYAKQKGLKRLNISVPLAIPSLSSFWIALITPIYMRVARKLVESALCSTVVHDPLAVNIFQVKPIDFKKALELAMSSKVPETRWNGAVSAAASLRNWSQENFGGRLSASDQIFVPFAVEHAFAPIRKIGGAAGYYSLNFLWKLCGMGDLLLGGVGFRRGRRDLDHLRPGDVIDFWRVIAYEPNRYLKLLAEIKIPGRAVLEFRVNAHEEGSEVIQKAIFDPVGAFGIIYWYLMYPLHYFIFSRMFRGIIKNMKDSS